MGEEDVGFVVGGYSLADVGDADEELPLSRRKRAGQIGWRGVGGADGEVVFVAAAPAAESLGVEEAEVERGVLVFSGVIKCNCYRYDSIGDGERCFDVGVVLASGDGAFEDDVGFGLCVEE